MPLVYLDTCALQRPLDDRTQFKVRVQADAIETVIAAVEAGDPLLATSGALRAETHRGRHRDRREFALAMLALAVRDLHTTPEAEDLARTFEDGGIQAFDALHLALAVVARADYFCTTDEPFFKRAKRMETGATRVVSPVELVVALHL